MIAAIAALCAFFAVVLPSAFGQPRTRGSRGRRAPSAGGGPTLGLRHAVGLALILGALARSPLVMTSGPLIALGSRRVLRWREGRRRQQDRIDEMVVLVDRILADLNSGSSLGVAIARSARCVSGQLRLDLDPLVRRLDTGTGMSGAVECVLGIDESLDLLALTLKVTTSSGGSSGPALERLAATLRDRARAASEAGAQTSQAVSSAVVMASLPLVFGMLVALLDSDVAAFYYRSWFGAVCVAVALGLVGAGLVWMNRVVEGSVR